MATKTGNTYISGTMTDNMTIPTANLWFSTTLGAKKLTPGNIHVFGANLAIFGSRALSQSFG